MAVVPAIPLHLLRLPTSGGLVIPWVTAQEGDRAAFGGLDLFRTQTAVLMRWCQICGKPLGDKMIYIVRPRDERAGWLAEPAMHPECARYATAACPMLNGQADHYRTAPLQLQHLNASGGTWTTGPESSAAHRHRAHHAAEDYNAWWVAADQYRIHQPASGPAGIALRDVTPLKVRVVRKSESTTALERFKALLGAVQQA